jgi:hypothetical protein
MKTSKTKTFQKGDDYGELIEWFIKQIEVHEYQPDGTSSYGDNLAPFDPVCELVAKYTVTITKTE